MRLALATVMLGLAAMTATPNVSAQAASLAPIASRSAVVDTAPSIQTIDYRGYHRGYGGGRGYYGGGRGYYGRNRGLGIGLGIAGAVIAGGLIAEEARRSRYYGYYDEPQYYAGGSGYSRCARTFRSFDPDTGTYTGYDGETHRCPYI